ncbi:MAG: recombinase family protein, partial [Synergistaceae bacterium]|nr:recombinase family protein [Synergistaceae bacterium]
MSRVYGYCRISTPKQNIERQVRNILSFFPQAIIVREIFSGTKYQGRRELEKILAKINSGDTIVFDSVSRMSRNAVEGFKLYEELYDKGIELVFLKERHIDTRTYRQELEKQINLSTISSDEITNDFIKGMIEVLNNYMKSLAKKQIEL